MMREEEFAQARSRQRLRRADDLGYGGRSASRHRQLKAGGQKCGNFKHSKMPVWAQLTAGFAEVPHFISS
jgi:hypothetical protein